MVELAADVAETVFVPPATLERSTVTRKLLGSPESWESVLSRADVRSGLVQRLCP